MLDVHYAIRRVQSSIGQRAHATGRHLTTTALVIALFAMAAGGCATSRTLDGIVIANVNEEPFTARDLEDDYITIHGGHTTMLLAGKGAVREFLDKALDRRLLVQEAYRIGLDSDPSTQEVLRDLRRARAREGLLKDRVESPVKIEPAEIQDAADRLKVTFDVRRIVVPTREEADAALARVRAGEDFGQLASSLSMVEGDRGRGGLLVAVSWGVLPPALEERLYALHEGEVGAPFTAPDGWTILKVEHRVGRETVDIARARPFIENVLRMRARQARLESLRAELMRRWKPVIYDERIVAGNFFGSEPPDIVLAEVGEERIGLRELRAGLSLDALRRLPEAAALFRIRRYLREHVVFERALVLEGLRLGYGDRPEVEQELRRVQNGMLLEKIVTGYVYAGVSVTDEDVATYYRDHPKEFSLPRRAKVRSILVPSEGEAGQVRDAIAQGKNFGDLAREQSKDALTSAIGGEMGWMVEGRTRPPFSGLVFALSPGEVAVARDGDGYRVVQVEQREEAKLRPFDEVREDARSRTLAAKRLQEVRSWVTKLRAASVIQIRDAGIVEAEQAFQKQAKARLERHREQRD